ncbi:hypothetical protein MRB53_010607 [Persea americana]|uniref:Uncharacterized protein n=1 Tax=Persea americana TaxID=3435 RepID=A0ACC2LSH9_PERAE|nr:hypothetical protein MRB53_010607 [Persea americana]
MHSNMQVPTTDRIASAMRHRMKHERPQRMAKTMRKAPSFPPKSALRRSADRSACVTAIFLAIWAAELKLTEVRSWWNGSCKRGEKEDRESHLLVTKALTLFA